MQSVTAAYLVDIVSRSVNKTILVKRLSQNPSCYVRNSVADENEINDFIVSIPFFDGRLKNFMLGKVDNTTIVSQAWETMFGIKCRFWAENENWLQSNPLFSISMDNLNAENDKNILTLPY